MWIFKIWTKSLRAERSPNACEVLPVQALPGYPRPGKDSCSFPQLVSHRLGALESRGQAGEAPLMVQQFPLGWESQGYKSLTGKRKSLLGGKSEPWALLLQQKMPSSFPHFIPVSGIKDIQFLVPQIWM